MQLYKLMRTIIVKRMYLYNGASREKKFEIERDKSIDLAAARINYDEMHD